MSGPFDAFLSRAVSDCVNANPPPTYCAECGKRTDEWVRVYISDHDRAPVCLECAAWTR